MADGKFSLTLTIDGRKYPLRIDPKQEEVFRRAAKEINNKINQYRVTYGTKNSKLTSQDFMAMTAIQALVQSLSLKDKNDTKPYEDKISQLIKDIDLYLEKKDE